MTTKEEIRVKVEINKARLALESALDAITEDEAEAAVQAIAERRASRRAIEQRLEMLRSIATWDNIFNTGHALWALDCAIEAAATAKYPMYAWNDRVYGTDSSSMGDDNFVCFVSQVPFGA